MNFHMSHQDSGYVVNSALQAHFSEGTSVVTWQPCWQGETHTPELATSPLISPLLFFTEELVLEVHDFTLPRLFR